MANNNNGILSGIYSGLSSTYSLLASQYPNGLTLENISEARTKTSNTNVLNQSLLHTCKLIFPVLIKMVMG